MRRFSRASASIGARELSDVRYGDYAIDQVAADVKSDGANVTLAPLVATRNKNLLQVSGTFQLPAPNEKLLKQPADLQLTLRAPQFADYWQSDAPNKVTGELQADGTCASRRRRERAGQSLRPGDHRAKVDRETAERADHDREQRCLLKRSHRDLNEQDYVNAHGNADCKSRSLTAAR